MGVLPALEIYKMIRAGDLLIEPFELRDELTPPATIDLRLSAKIRRYDFGDEGYLLGDEIPDEQTAVEEMPDKTVTLEPGHGFVFVLYERLVLPASVAGILLPRSSLTRLGVSLQPTYINPGYQGHCPILLVNHAQFPVRVPFRGGLGPRVSQILFWELASPPHRRYGEGLEEKYQHDKGFPSRFDKDIDITELVAPFKTILDRI